MAIAIEDLEEMYRKKFTMRSEKAKACEIIGDVKTVFKRFLDEASRYKMRHL